MCRSHNIMEKPACVRSDLWEKFKKLEKRADDLLEKNPKSKSKPSENNAKKEHCKESSESDSTSKTKDATQLIETPVTGKEIIKQENSEDDSTQMEWKELKQYLNINSHLQSSTASMSAPKSGMEKKINKAITSGDIETAESLSDSLAVREFATKITGSFDAREYLKRKKAEEMTTKAKKKKKLHWGFEHKQRWEMKGNM